MKIRHFIFIPIFGVLTVGAIAGTATTSEGSASGSFKGGSTLSNEDIEDVGELKEVDATDLTSGFRGSVRAQAQYTSNAKLQGSHGSGDFIGAPTMDVGYNLPFGEGFSLDLAAKLESYLYARYNKRSFWGYSGALTLDYRLKNNQKLPRVYLGVEPYQYHSYNDGDRLAEAVGFTAGIDQGFLFNQDMTLLALGYSYSSYYASPALDNRDVHRGLIALTHQFRPSFYGQLYYQFQYGDFSNQSREDKRHAIGVNFICQLTQHLFANVSGNWVDSDSTQNLADYQTAGASAGLTYQFW